VPREVSATGLASILAESTSEVWLIALKIDHVDLASPIYLVHNNQDLTLGGQAHTAYPFSVSLPSDDVDAPPTAKLIVDNISRTLIDEIRSVTGESPTFELSVYLASDTATPQIGPVTLDSRSADYDTETISINLKVEDLGVEPYPYKSFTPEKFPGLFSR